MLTLCSKLEQQKNQTLESLQIFTLNKHDMAEKTDNIKVDLISRQAFVCPMKGYERFPAFHEPPLLPPLHVSVELEMRFTK